MCIRSGSIPRRLGNTGQEVTVGNIKRRLALSNTYRLPLRCARYDVFKADIQIRVQKEQPAAILCLVISEVRGSLAGIG